MDIDVPGLLHLVAHELRTPALVAQGYLRMLTDGDIAPEAQARVLTQLRDATSRIALLGREATELARWLEIRPEPPSAASTALRPLLDRAVATAGLGDRAAVIADERDVHVITSNPTAVETALRTLAQAVARERPAETLRIAVRPNGEPRAIDIVISVGEAVPTLETAEPINLQRGGLGLSLALAAAIIAAHGGRLWSTEGRRDMIGVVLPLISLEES